MSFCEPDMDVYPFHDWTRVAVVGYDAMSATPDSPSVATLTGGVDITEYIEEDGFRPRMTESTYVYSPWHDDQTQETPIAHSTGYEITGLRRRQGISDPLWDACQTFRQRDFLVVRYGVEYDVPWAAGQEIMVTVGWWGRRIMDPIRSTGATFTVQFYGQRTYDDAAVAA